MVNSRQIELTFLEDRTDTMYQIYSETLENCHFYAFAILVRAAVGYLGLPSRINFINLKGLHLEIILVEFDQSL